MAPSDPTKQAQLMKEKGKWADATERLGKFDYQAYMAGTHDEQDKEGRTLAWLATPRDRGAAIVKSCDGRDDMVRTHHEINELLSTYYSILYAQPEVLNERKLT